MEESSDSADQIVFALGQSEAELLAVERRSPGRSCGNQTCWFWASWRAIPEAEAVVLRGGCQAVPVVESGT